MRKWHQDLHALNSELINNYKIRSNNHEELMNCLKQVNQIIQRAGRLRGNAFIYLLLFGYNFFIKILARIFIYILGNN